MVGLALVAMPSRLSRAPRDGMATSASPTQSGPAQASTLHRTVRQLCGSSLCIHPRCCASLRYPMKLRSLALPAFLVALLALAAGCGGMFAPKGPIKALLITGGCCHDYVLQAKQFTAGTKPEEVEWTVINEGGRGTRA